MKELTEYYRTGRGCKRDIMKAIELGSVKAVLEFEKSKEKEGNECEYMQYF